MERSENDDALIAAYSDRVRLLSELRRTCEFDAAPKHEQDLIDVAAFCISRALDAWGARTGARAAWEAWVYPILNDAAAPSESTETSEAAQ